MTDYSILETINAPADLKKLELSKLPQLCQEMRQAILNRVSKIGGHVGPNLGVVELAVALHYVFESPKDKIIWDVSHQSYPHKILTGRKAAFIDDTRFGECSGFTAPEESEHDIFTIGHTSTSVSLAYGLAKARDAMGNKENIIAILGMEDGNDAAELIHVLQQAKDTQKPLVIHVHTLKGCGYKPATEDKEHFHWTTPFNLETGKNINLSSSENYGAIIADYLDKKAAADKRIMVINAGTPGALCLQEYREKHPSQYIDAGIAEEHAVASASGMAHYGIKPVALFFGGFIQRA